MTTAKEHPILFSGPMVRAILEGRKTQTRRVIKPQPPCNCGVTPEEMSRTSPEGWQLTGHSGRWWCPCCTGDWEIRCPFGVPGDRLWVREGFAYVGGCDPGLLIFKADYPACVPAGFENIPPIDQVQWASPIFMPRKASRITLEVKRVWVERVQEISEGDALDEGAQGVVCQDLDINHDWYPNRIIPAFKRLWDTINTKPGHTWDDNPWVWCVEFERVEVGS